MSKKERERKAILSRVSSGELSQASAARRLGLSYRQLKRIYKRYRLEGDAGLVHKSRGQPSPRAYNEFHKSMVLKLYEEKYQGFGATLASEKLLALEDINISTETLRQWLLSAGLLTKRRRRSKHRSHRERRSRFGELVQLDGSIHEWIYGRSRQDCLLNMVDDATGKTLSFLDTGETTYGVLMLLWQWIKKYGIPEAFYVDLKSVYVSPKSLKSPNPDETYDGAVESEWLTVFSRVCKCLGIAVIKAYSPQAKGHVERSHGVYQDRFVKELKLRGITTLAEANKLLRESFCDELNTKFARAPRSDIDAHVQLTGDEDLDQIICWEETRMVKNDWTIRYKNQYYQLPKSTVSQIRPRQKLTVRRHLDGRISLWHGEVSVPYEALGAAPQKLVQSKEKAKGGHSSSQRSQLSKANKHKSPWSQFNPNWLTPERQSRKATAI